MTTIAGKWHATMIYVLKQRAHRNHLGVVRLRSLPDHAVWVRLSWTMPAWADAIANNRESCQHTVLLPIPATGENVLAMTVCCPTPGVCHLFSCDRS